jgi:uncharacterized protein YbjT (DUF2867 family)
MIEVAMKRREIAEPRTRATAAPALSAFVAGATGYTGRALVRELCARGVRTVAHVRPDSPRLPQWQQHFVAVGATVDSSPWAEAALVETLRMQQPYFVFAMLGTTRSRARAARGSGSDDSYETVDYGLTSLLLAATLQAAPDAHFVYLSAMGVGPRARGGYLRVRWRMEQELRSSGIRHTIMRPAFITGADRDESRPMERAAAVMTDGVLALVGRLGGRHVQRRYRSRTGAELAREVCDRVGIAP